MVDLKFPGVAAPECCEFRIATPAVMQEIRTAGPNSAAGRDMSVKKGSRELLDEPNAEIEVVSPEEAAGLLDDDGTIFVDLRPSRG
jgi:hypothetical protein